MTDTERTNETIQKVRLILPDAIDCDEMFAYCTELTDVDLEIPNATNCYQMFYKCTSLTSVTLNLPKLSDYEDMFYSCSSLESIDVTIPTSIVSDFKSYVEGLELENLTSFIINGEEQL